MAGTVVVTPNGHINANCDEVSDIDRNGALTVPCSELFFGRQVTGNLVLTPRRYFKFHCKFLD